MALEYPWSDLEGMEAIEAGGPPKSVACKRGAGVASCTWVYLSPVKQAEERRDPLPQSPTCQEILLPLGREAYELYGLRAFEFIKCGTWVVPRKIKGLDISAEVFEKNGGPAGTRTPDPLIKSQLLYQLSYRPLREEGAVYQRPRPLSSYPTRRGVEFTASPVYADRRPDCPDCATIDAPQQGDPAMILVTVMYPNQEGSKFDIDYYLNNHLSLVGDRWGSMGLKGAKVVRGLTGGDPSGPAPYQIMALVEFDSLESFQGAVDAHGDEIFGDIPNFTDTTPTVQISEVIA
jgi:uncharacterized protein (TIGR02118 family)